jgi:dihydropyrimidine dehydrogenase (NAD+) subunit PreT
VIGAGNTAIDAAIAAVRLGATDVHIVYRRGEEQMSAFSFEYDHAKREGVQFLWHTQPAHIHGEATVESIELTPIAHPDAAFSLPVDLVVLAIGQATQTEWLPGIERERGRIVINRASGQTSNPKFFAGGDCTNGGREVVDAVADGKRAAIGIAAWLEAKHA